MASLLLLASAAALTPGLHVPSGRRAISPRRTRLVVASADADDTLIVYGDAATLVVYGLVQGAVDGALTPLATSNPELFTVTEALPAPFLQSTVLAAAWIATCKAMEGYRSELTRSRGTPVVVSCLSTWAVSSAVMLGASWLLHSQLGLGPGLREDEVNFVTGSLTVVGAWRLVCALALPY